MSQRNSEYERIPLDLYETPEWVTEALLPLIPPHIKTVWEPACGSGKMATVLANHRFAVLATDISKGRDFIAEPRSLTDAIITNPPFKLAREFIEKTLTLNPPFAAFLLRTDYDHAKTRQHLFGNCPRFAGKLVLTKRIVWFDRPGAAPSYNHAWFMWNRDHKGPPSLHYA